MYDDERRKATRHMKRLEALQEEARDLELEKGELSRDNQRLLGVLRRRQAKGISASLAAHRERLQNQRTARSEVNKGDLAQARLGLKASRQECERLTEKVREQVEKITSLEEAEREAQKQLEESHGTVMKLKKEKDGLKQDLVKAREAAARTASALEHKASEKASVLERLSHAEEEARQAGEARASAELEVETLRTELESVKQRLEDTGPHLWEGSLVKYQGLINTQAAALQAARMELLEERMRRREAEHAERLRHIARLDERQEISRARTTPGKKTSQGKLTGCHGSSAGRKGGVVNRSRVDPAATGTGEVLTRGSTVASVREREGRDRGIRTVRVTLGKQSVPGQEHQAQR
ncbi:unnamed protein product [Discosporangium mesarthrocarpum]